LNYQEIFKIALLLISSPARAWEEIRLQEDRRKVLVGFVYPLIGLSALSVFIGSLFTHGWGDAQSYQIAMTNCCISAVALFGGYFLASYIITEVGTKVFGLQRDPILSQQLAGYSLVVTFFTSIVTGVFPSFHFIGIILQFYIIYIVWEGTAILVGITGNGRLRYTLMASITLLICPFLIQLIFNKLLFLFN